MPLDALPERLQDPAAWAGTDDDKSGLFRWRLKKKGWFAYGPRSSKWWAKWREWPITVFAIRGDGSFRFEDDVRDFAFGRTFRWFFWWNHQAEYLSRIQLWCRWSFQVQWPFMVAFHVYYRAGDVPTEPNHLVANAYSLKRMFYFYIGCHRDSDKVYWFPSAFIGGVWK